MHPTGLPPLAPLPTASAWKPPVLVRGVPVNAHNGVVARNALAVGHVDFPRDIPDFAALARRWRCEGGRDRSDGVRQNANLPASGPRMSQQLGSLHFLGRSLRPQHGGFCA
eukprot:scaffold317_cov260-Pinguiococcus_pyrenoidosus.AAC.48